MEKCCLLIYLPFFGLCLFVRLLFVVSLVCLGGGGGGFLAEVAVIYMFVRLSYHHTYTCVVRT